MLRPTSGQIRKDSRSRSSVLAERRRWYGRQGSRALRRSAGWRQPVEEFLALDELGVQEIEQFLYLGFGGSLPSGRWLLPVRMLVAHLPVQPVSVGCCGAGGGGVPPTAGRFSDAPGRLSWWCWVRRLIASCGIAQAGPVSQVDHDGVDPQRSGLSVGCRCAGVGESEHHYSHLGIVQERGQSADVGRG